MFEYKEGQRVTKASTDKYFELDGICEDDQISRDGKGSFSLDDEFMRMIAKYSQGLESIIIEIDNYLSSIDDIDLKLISNTTLFSNIANFVENNVFDSPYFENAIHVLYKIISPDMMHYEQYINCVLIEKLIIALENRPNLIINILYIFYSIISLNPNENSEIFDKLAIYHHVYVLLLNEPINQVIYLASLIFKATMIASYERFPEEIIQIGVKILGLGFNKAIIQVMDAVCSISPNSKPKMKSILATELFNHLIPFLLSEDDELSMWALTDVISVFETESKKCILSLVDIGLLDVIKKMLVIGKPEQQEFIEYIVNRVIMINMDYVDVLISNDILALICDNSQSGAFITRRVSIAFLCELLSCTHSKEIWEVLLNQGGVINMIDYLESSDEDTEKSIIMAFEHLLTIDPKSADYLIENNIISVLESINVENPNFTASMALIERIQTEKFRNENSL